MGLPGAILLIAADSILMALGGLFGYRGILYSSEGDPYVWSAAILLTLALCPILSAAYIVAFRRLHHARRWKQWLAYTLTILILGTGTTLWMYLSLVA